MKFDLIETWLNTVGISHSNSDRTREGYRNNLLLFCTFIEKSPEQILKEYEDSTDREFKRKYSMYLRGFMSSQLQKRMSQCTIGARMAAVKSFFKYNDLPLAFVPYPKLKVTYHNRDINHEEIKLIVNESDVRESAFYSLQAQSGLRPATICNLRFKHVKEDLLADRVPCKIDVPEEIAKGNYRSHFSFCGHETVKYLKLYLKPDIRDGDFLFTKQGSSKMANSKSFSGLFGRTVQKLYEKGLIDVEQKQYGKPRNIRLYTLRGFFRNQAGQAGADYVNFWMGHKLNYKAPHIPSSDEHYFSRELVEKHRTQYVEKAMPFLRFETEPLTNLEKILEEKLEERDKEIEKLKTQLEDVTTLKSRFEGLYNLVMEMKDKPAITLDLSKLKDEKPKVYEEFLSLFRFRLHGPPERLELPADFWTRERKKRKSKP